MIRFIFAHEKLFSTHWDQFVSNNKVTWRYTYDWQKFLAINAEKTINKNLSFIIVREKIPIALCTLFLENISDIVQFSIRNGYLNAPIYADNLQSKDKKEIEQLCFMKIDELAKKHKVRKCMFLIDPLSRKETFNYLIKYQYLDSSINTNIVNLNENIEELWSKLRKSYRSIIKCNQDKYRIFIMNSKNADKKIHEIYRNLHHKAAGKVTRPRETFDIEFDMLQKNYATLICLMEKEQYIAVSYFYHNGTGVYYGSSADDPELTHNIPYEHSILWSAIEYFKKTGFTGFELGWQHFSQQLFDQPSKKEIDISFFKRGFGGTNYPLFRGIKYYNHTLMKKECNDAILLLEQST